MPNKVEFSTNLSELEPYILGRKFSGECKNQPRGNAEIFQKFVDMVDQDEIAKTFFEAYNLAADFYNTMIDFKHFIPKDMRDEVFYAAKNGVLYTQVPALCVYLLRTAWEQCYGIPNLIFKVIPATALRKFCEKGYFLGGLTLMDVVCNICSEEYKPLSLYHPKNKLKEFTEIYVPATDMVVAVPHSIGDLIDENNVTAISCGPNGLEIEGMFIRTLANHVGAVNSVYDLRSVL